MGLFDKAFKSQRDISKKEIQEVPWHALTEQKQLEEIEEKSTEKTVVIFKHSTRCGISRMVLGNFEKELDLPEDSAYELYFLDLIANREISNKVAEKFGVRHESPQLIIIRNKEVVHHSSHSSVKAETVRDFVA